MSILEVQGLICNISTFLRWTAVNKNIWNRIGFVANKIIENELSGVFNWVLEGLNRLLEQKGFSKCSAAEEAVAEYKKQSDSVKMFVEENNFVISPNEYTLIKELYPHYRQYCSEDGYKAVSKVNFSKRLKNFNIIVQRVAKNKLAAYLTKKLPS